MREKTAGNPFFVIQFLHALAEEGLLHFDHDAACWRWDLDRIRAKDFTDNVVDLVVGKLSCLPVETQHVLQRLACLGPRRRPRTSLRGDEPGANSGAATTSANA